MLGLDKPLPERETETLAPQYIKKRYNELARELLRIHNEEILYCHSCNRFKLRSEFLKHPRYKSGFFPDCEQCLIEQGMIFDERTKTFKDDKEKTIEVFRKLDLPYIDSVYEQSLQQIEMGKTKISAFINTLKAITSLKAYYGLHFRDSEFDKSRSEFYNNPKNKGVIEKGVRRFGVGLNDEDYIFLESEYEDWVSRYECNKKSQEVIFERLAFKKWEIMKATRTGKPTDNLDKSLQSLLSTCNITPKQDEDSAEADSSYTFGTLLKKWEDERPLPEIDPELEDVDKIGFYYNVFLGHTSKMVGLKNTFSRVYDAFIKKFTVNRPQEDSENDSEVIFDKIFGSKIGGD